MFKKHGTTTIRNFDALNDVSNLEYSAKCINRHGLNHEVVVTVMDLPPGQEVGPLQLQQPHDLIHVD